MVVRVLKYNLSTSNLLLIEILKTAKDIRISARIWLTDVTSNVKDEHHKNTYDLLTSNHLADHQTSLVQQCPSSRTGFSHNS